MPRILYYMLANQRLSGGQKMAVRHVETLRELGFDAHCLMPGKTSDPVGLVHTAPILRNAPIQPDDVVVIGEDSPGALQAMIGKPNRAVLFCQAFYGMVALTLPVFDRFPPDARPSIMVVGPELRRNVLRMYPDAHVELTPCFADERVFQPREDKQFVIAASMVKRPEEQGVIDGILRRTYRDRALPEWRRFEGLGEAEVADLFGTSALMLSTNRAESVGLTTLEAMASGCVCAGFLGVGGLQYGHPDNGFWAADDDCVGAADAVAQAADLVRTGGPALRRMKDAARATADQWSYARFRAALEAAWMRLAPDARSLATSRPT